MDNKLFVFKIVESRENNQLGNVLSLALWIANNAEEAEAFVRESIIDDSDGEIGPFKTVLYEDFDLERVQYLPYCEVQNFKNIKTIRSKRSNE